MWRLSACHQLILLISVPLVSADYVADLSGGRDHDFEMSAFVQTQTRVHLSASAGSRMVGSNYDHQNLSTFTLSLPYFSKLTVDNGIKTTVSVGDATTVSITMLGEAVDRLDANVKDYDTLYLGLKFGHPSNAEASATITVAKPLTGATCLGGSAVSIDTLNGLVKVDGGAHAKINSLDAPGYASAQANGGSHLEIGNLNTATALITAKEGSHVKVMSGTSQSCTARAKAKSHLDLGSFHALSANIISNDESDVSGLVAEVLSVAVTAGSVISTTATGSVTGWCSKYSKFTIAGGVSTSKVGESEGCNSW